MPAHKDIISIITPEAYKEINELQVVKTTQIVPVASELVKKAAMNLSVNGSRTLRVLYSLITPADKPNRIYRFDLQSYAKAFGLSSGKIYTVMNSACSELRETLKLPIGKGRVTGLISWAQVTDNEVQIGIDPALLEIYKKEKEKHTYHLSNISGLAYGITFKFYDLLIIQLGDADEAYFRIEIDDLKDFLEISNKYMDYRDFKRRILAMIVNDINGYRPNESSRIIENNRCNIHVEFDEEKERRRVVAIIFKIRRIKENEIIDAEIIRDFSATLPEEERFAYCWLRDQMKVAPATIKECISKDRQNPSQACFLKIYKYIAWYFSDLQRANKIHNKPAWAAKALRNRYYNDVEEPAAKKLNISLEQYFVRVEMLKDQKIFDEERIAELILISEEKVSSIQEADEEISSFSEAYISSNIDYITNKYVDKTIQERTSLIVKALKNDYAGFIALLEEELANEKEAARLKELREKLSRLSIEELEQFAGEDYELAQQILQEKREELRRKKVALAEELFNEFMLDGTAEEKLYYKLKAIESMAKENRFMFNVTMKSLKDKGYMGSLEDAPLELLMKTSAFSTKFRFIWKSENVTI